MPDQPKQAKISFLRSVLGSPRRVLFILSSLVPLLGVFSHPPGVTLILYSIYVWARLLPPRLWQRIGPCIPRSVIFIFLALLVCVLTESLAWLTNYFDDFRNPGALFSINYLKDLGIGSGYYLGFALAVIPVVMRFRFTAGELFCTYGAFGMFLEQQGAVAKAAYATAMNGNLLLAVIMFLYVFAVHGSIAGLMFMPVEHRYPSPSRSRWRYPIVLVAMAVGVFLGTYVSATLTSYLMK
jgi:hypothetical protein